MRAGLKRRAGTEARIGIPIRNFMGKPARAKGFANRELMVRWSVRSHNLWVLACLEQHSLSEKIERQSSEAA